MLNTFLAILTLIIFIVVISFSLEWGRDGSSEQINILRGGVYEDVR